MTNDIAADIRLAREIDPGLLRQEIAFGGLLLRLAAHCERLTNERGKLAAKADRLEKCVKPCCHWDVKASNLIAETQFMLLAKAEAERDRAYDAIRKHRDQRGDDRCWMDDEELYRALPEGFTPPERDSHVELSLCARFIHCRRNPATEYVSPQRRIEELEAERDKLAARVAELEAGPPPPP